MSIIEVRPSHFDGRGSKKDFLVHLVILLIHGSEFLIKGGDGRAFMRLASGSVLSLGCLLGALAGWGHCQRGPHNGYALYHLTLLYHMKFLIFIDLAT